MNLARISKLFLRNKSKILRKHCARCLASILLLTMLLPNASATEDYQIQIAVLCTDPYKSHEFIDSMCREQSRAVLDDPTAGLHMTAVFTGERNVEGPGRTVLYAPDIDTRYHILFRPMIKLDVSTIRGCSGAIILYDIADPSLDPIADYRGSYPPGDLKRLLSIHTPLVQYINSLQCSKDPRLWPYWKGGGNYGWYKGINFVAYCSDPSLSREAYDVRHEYINSFTCRAECYIGIDNKWGRGHPCMGFDDSSAIYGKKLYWIQGAAYRSIGEGWVTGEYKPPAEDEERLGASLPEEVELSSFSDDSKPALPVARQSKKKNDSGNNLFRRVIIGIFITIILPIIYGFYRIFHVDRDSDKEGEA